MKRAHILVAVVAFVIGAGIVSPVHADPVTLGLEKMAASYMARYGALYGKCGSPADMAAIGGSFTAWRANILSSYVGLPDEQLQLQQTFDSTASAVYNDRNSCANWAAQVQDIRNRAQMFGQTMQ
jgi:hypothetical protein